MAWNTVSLSHGPLPLWSQIADRLRAALEMGEFVPGDCLPSEAELNQAFGVSRSTARVALDKLETEGRIMRRSGKGSIVLAPQVDQPLNLLSSFAEDMRARGLVPSYLTRSIKTLAAPWDVAEALDVTSGEALGMIDRLLLANGVVIGLSLSWLSSKVVDVHKLPTLAELDAGSLYRWIEQRCGVRIAGGSEFIEAMGASDQVAASLSVAAGAAVLVARRISRSEKETPIEYAVLYYRADLYRFHVELRRP
jgi:GntR family transcriptional regulator